MKSLCLLSVPRNPTKYIGRRADMDGQADYYEHQLLWLASKSKQDFVREYKKYDEATGRGVYHQVLTGLTKAISEGNVDSLKEISNLMDYIVGVKTHVTLRDYYNNARNPIRSTNLVILACKHNKVDILKTIFSNSSLLDNLSINVGSDAIAPNDKDETRHDAFYYAIRSGNVELIDTLITEWPHDYFAARSGELDEVLSKAYEELKLKNVPLSEVTEMFVENKLISLRFFSNTSGKVQRARDAINNIRERVNLVLENIDLLKADYLTGKEVDDKFLFITKCIAQNVHVLKRQLKSTYDRLPWEEIEFCLVSFVSCHLKRQEINLFYSSTLNKRKILNHMERFANKLEDAKYIIENAGSIDQLSDLPRLRREQVVAEIVSNCPKFKELYSDYQQIRDIHSLEKINSYIGLALSADPKEREGQLIITRVLQVIGEYLKNTLESPKLSNATSELLIQTLPKNSRKIIVDLRNSLSHSYSLFKRTEIEENSDMDFFVGVQNDTKRVGVVVADILYNNKVKMIRILLEQIASSNTIEEIKEVLTVFSTVELDVMSTDNFKMTEHDKLIKLTKEFSDSIADKTIYEKQMFDEINKIISSASAPTENIRSDYIAGYALLKSLSSGFCENNMNNNVIRGMKLRANQTLQSMTSKTEPRVLEEVARLSLNIVRGARKRMQPDNLDEVMRTVCEIVYIAGFGTDDIKYMDELRGKLNEAGSFIPLYNQQRKAYNVKAEKYNDQLAQKISELKDILSNKLSIFASKESLSLYRKDTKLQAVVEMLVLDIMSILGRSNKYLANNLLFLDDNSPLLNGKCLRNHLAHDNALVDILLSDPSIIVILNAKKLTEENILRSKKQIGKLVNDDPCKLKDKYNQGLVSITYQERMFAALEEGNLEGLKDCLQNGADINARNINSWAALHFAAKGPSLDVLKFILDQSESRPNIKDTSGQSPLHVAAAYGRTNTVEFLLNASALHVDDLDNMGRTPLHMAAQSGHKDTVELLVERKANTAAQDFSGISALYHSIRNNHIDVAKILLLTEANVDVNEAMGGFTPLHEAAECGYLELVNFLLQNKADVNARNDRDWTPLHAAALYGHLDIVDALMLKGSDVNARVINGCTPLHYAVEYGHEKIVSTLLTHGANVNAADKSYKYTPLHLAAKYGYIGIVKILLKSKANANVGSVGGTTPLHLAARSNHLEIVNALLKHGVSIHTKDTNNTTPLHYAVEKGHKEIAEFLIQKGADVNANTYTGLTPLHSATIDGYHGIVDLLLRNGARVDSEDTKGNTPLHRAASKGSIDVIELLIKNKGKVNPRNILGMTPLHVAARCGHLDAIGYLVKNKADVNARATHGLTPLHGAVVGGHRGVVTLLIKNKAKLDARGIEDSTPLYLAVEAGDKDIVEILVANGANSNVMCNNITPLHTAIKGNQKEIAEVLISNGAIVNTEGTLPPLQIAVLAGYKDIVEMLLKNKANVNIKNPDGFTALHLAAKRGNKDIVNILIKRGADVDAKNNNNMTPLYLAAQEGYEEVVEMLVKNGASVNVTSAEGTPLLRAAGLGHAGVVKHLLDNGANINLKDDENRTPLELAVGRGHLQVVKVLLRHKKVDMNYKGNNNFTILHIASQESNVEMVEYLVEEGCDINARNVSGSKSIHIASREGHRDTVQFFLGKGQSINEPGNDNQTVLHYAAAGDQLEVVRYLISEGADVNAQDDTGLSPMHFAALLGHKDVIEALLKSGAVYNAADRNYRTPLVLSKDRNVTDLLATIDKLFKAVKHNKPTDVESCIGAGAIVDVKNADGVTPLHYAAWKGYDAVVNVLLQNKADPNAATTDGITPLHYAAKYSQLKVVKALISHGAVYNSVADSGKTPSDLAADEGITSLLQLVSESFKNIKKGGSKVIDDLNRIKDVDTIKAIMGARNEEGETLIAAAVHNNFSEVDQLKAVSQGDVAYRVDQALCLLSEGNYQAALSIFKSAFESRKELLGPVNPGTLDIQMHIARVQYAQGFYEEALRTFEDIFQKQRDVLGLHNKDTLNTWGLVAVILHKLDKKNKAFSIFKEVYQKQTEILGPNHSDTLDTLLHMALVLDGQGRYEEALNANRTVFEKRKAILGADSCEALRAQNNIALVLGHQGKYEEALQIYKEVYEKKKVVFGVNHCDTLRTMHNIAGVLCNQTKYHEALLAFQEVLSIQKSVLGPNHPDTLNSQYNMANVLYAQGKWIGALKAYREGFDQMKAVFGSSHPSVLDILEKLKAIHMIFKIEGHTESEVLQHLQQEIHTAASNGDTQALQRLIQFGADVNVKDIDGRTPLHYAISNGRLGIVNILLEAGADVTQVTNKGNTPLHTATSKGYTEIVHVLLQHVNRDRLSDLVNAKTTASGTTSLHIAVKGGYLEIVKSLLQHGAIHDIQDKQGKVPLDFCQDQITAVFLKFVQELFGYAKNGNVEIISKLKAAKPDEFLSVTNARNKQGNTLMQVVITNKHNDIVCKLQEMFNMEGPTESLVLQQLQKDIHLAARNGDTQAVQRLIQIGADVKVKDIDGRTPLHYAISNGRLGIVKVLLEAGADVTQVTNKGNTPLHTATSKGYTEIVQVLLQHVNRDRLSDLVNAKTAASATASLHIAVKGGYLEIVKSLLQHGAIHDIQDKQGKVPLDFCQDQTIVDLLKLVQELFKYANNGNVEIISKLKAAKPDEFLSVTNARNKQGNTLMQVVITNKHNDIVCKLQEMFNMEGSTESEVLQHLQQEIHTAASNGDTQAVQRLIQIGADVKVKDIDGRTPLHYAISNGRLGIVKILLEAGADVTQVTNKGNTPLHTATSKGYTEIVQVLLQQVNRDKLSDLVNAKTTASGTTSLHIAVKGGDLEIVKSLLQHGAIYDVQDKQGKVPLDFCQDQTTAVFLKFVQELFGYAKNGNAEIISKLKAAKPDEFLAVTNARNKQGSTLLQVVIINKHKNIASKLQEMFEIEGRKKSVVLQRLQENINFAARNGDTQAVQRLIKIGADVNVKDIDGRTPLHYAISNRRLGIVNILLEAGADVTQVTNKGNTPLHTATSKGYTEIVQVLLQQVNRDKLSDLVNAKTTASGTTSLHIAVKGGDLEIVKSLLQHGAIYDVQDKQGKVPLDFCQDQTTAVFLKFVQELFGYAKNGNVEIISKLKAAKPDEFLAVTNARNKQGSTLLQVVIINKHKNIASKLLGIMKPPN